MKTASATRLCVYCRRQVSAWLPVRGGMKSLSPFILNVGPVGSNLDIFFCPHCQCWDRERYLRLYIERSDALRSARGGSALHIAPTPHFRQFIQSHGFSRYVCGDLNSADPSIERMDLMDLPYQVKNFDIFICNHVLEHVDDERKALSEIYRVLKPGARMICQTPYATRLSRTFEDRLLQSPEDRVFFYSQHDHVRMFGADIAELFLESGFVGRLVPHHELLPDIDPDTYGMNGDEPFFDFVREEKLKRRIWRLPRLLAARHAR